ncbi:hypothetical protein CRM71_08260 [Prevotella jejuni]|uniref:Uncharacterized protein n=1 Tax=Prevotella jejuni TaxID=1177574 RepID=A0A2K9H9N4_9BACT|nr:hypothetical protein CRM71_08260 [Prevotella jejuni]SNS11107.1 hypothetical protein SAMN06265364_1435 [Prevotella jejuni]
MGKLKILELSEAEHLELERGFRLYEKHCFRMHCNVAFLKVGGLSATRTNAQTRMSFVSVNIWVKWYKEEDLTSLKTSPDCERFIVFSTRTRENRYKKFTITERMTADKIFYFLDYFPFCISKDILLFLIMLLCIATDITAYLLLQICRLILITYL